MNFGAAVSALLTAIWRGASAARGDPRPVRARRQSLGRGRGDLRRGDGAAGRALSYDNVFSIFSVTKAFTNVLILKAIEEGRFALTTKVRDVLPEFTGAPREDATFYHLLTHTAGMPGVWTPKPGHVPRPAAGAVRSLDRERRGRSAAGHAAATTRRWSTTC